MNNLRIEIVKTWYGNKYAVVGDFKHFPASRDSKGNIVTSGTGKNKKNVTDTAFSRRVADYKHGDKLHPALFELSKEGLAKAKEILALYKK